jgi:hypothetical protein
VLFGCHGALDSHVFRMPCGTVHPKQRVIRADVPGFWSLRTPAATGLLPVRAGVAAPPQTPFRR